jgi:hypothetical protein
MKRCKYRKHIEAYVDRELPARGLVERVGEHLAQCPGCRAYCDEIRALKTAFGGRRLVLPPPELERAILDRAAALGAAGRNERFRETAFLFSRKAIPAMVAFSLIVVLLFITSLSREPKSQSVSYNYHTSLYALNQYEKAYVSGADQSASGTFYLFLKAKSRGHARERE